MHELEHPNTESLQGYAESAIGESDRAVLESHLLSCSRCTAEVEEWRSLFATLAALPQFDPSPTFAARVMAQVRLPASVPMWSPWLSRAQQLLARLTPKTRAGWTFATAFLALPVLLGGGVLAWLFSREYITVQSLWVFVSERTTSSMEGLGAAALKGMMQSDATAWLLQQGQSVVAEIGMRGLGALAFGVASMIMLSIWILYKNLFRTPTRETNHVYSH